MIATMTWVKTGKVNRFNFSKKMAVADEAGMDGALTFYSQAVIGALQNQPRT